MKLAVSACLYAAVAGLFLVAFGTVFGASHPLIDLLGQFLLPSLVGAVAVALLAASTKRHVVALLALATLPANLILVWPWLQAPAPESATGPRFTLMSYNVYVYNRELDRIAAFIAETKPDILILLEIVPRVRAELDNVAGQYPYRIECWQDRWCDALILSRFPLSDLKATLPQPGFRRPIAAVDVAIEGRKLTLFAAHLSLPGPLEGSDKQIRETEEVGKAFAGIAGPRMIAGDFNASPWGATMTMLRERTATTILTGPGATWPTFLPRNMGIPIDHVLATNDLVLKSRRVLTGPGSDHRAVLAELAFRQ